VILYWLARGKENTQVVVANMDEGKKILSSKLNAAVPSAAKYAMKSIDETGQWSNGFLTAAIM